MTTSRRDRRASERARLLRFTYVVVTATLLGFAFLEASIVLPAAAQRPGVSLGMDYSIYMERARSWLAGEGFYHPWQLGGPYPVSVGSPALYPPTLLYLLVPFTVLPALLWWAFPLTVIGVSLWRLRPSPWAWPILAAILVYPRTWIALTYGNPSMWIFAALTAGLVWTWPLAFVVLKPTLAPFALLGVRSRSFWMALAGVVGLSAALGTLWFDYLVALVNAQNAYGPEYLLGEVPIALALLCAWAAAPGGTKGPFRSPSLWSTELRGTRG